MSISFFRSLELVVGALMHVGVVVVGVLVWLWFSGLGKAAWRVAGELPSPNFRRFALIVTEAARSGARLPEVLDVAARSFATVAEFRQAAASQLRPYVALFYTVVAVFAVLVDVLVYMLLSQLTQLTASAPTQQGVRPVALERSAFFMYLAS